MPLWRCPERGCRRDPGTAVGLTHQNGATLSFGFAISLVVALWIANSGVSGLFDALNAVYEEKDPRSLLKYYAMTLAFTAGAIVLVLLSIAILVALPIILQHVPDAGVTALLLKIARWPVLFVFVVFSLARRLPIWPLPQRARWRWIAWSSVFAAVAWLVVSALFSWYVASFGSYNKTYGSLGAIFGFMTWIWVSMVVILVGAKLDAELERRNERPRCTQPARANAFGARKARMCCDEARHASEWVQPPDRTDVLLGMLAAGHAPVKLHAPHRMIRKLSAVPAFALIVIGCSAGGTSR